MGVRVVWSEECPNMTHRTIHLVIVAMFFSAAMCRVMSAQPKKADPKKDAVKRELEKLQGTWTVASREMKAQKTPAEDLKELQLIIKDDRWTMKHAAGSDKATIKIDPTKEPKTIDLNFSSLGAMGGT